MKIDARGKPYKELNKIIRTFAANREKEFELIGVNGQRYIGDGLNSSVRITIKGTPGNDLGAFMNGASIVVYGNCQDGVANTMNSGEIIVHGSLGDVAGYGMRGGRLFVRGDVGYRVGIHMKEYKKQVPVIISGGTAGDFFGEYMAGGIMVLLGLGAKDGKNIVGDYVGTGMHGGVIFIRGKVETHRLEKEVAVLEPSQEDLKLLTELLKRYCGYFGLDLDEVMSKKFIKLVPLSHRPYGDLYAY